MANNEDGKPKEKKERNPKQSLFSKVCIQKIKAERKVQSFTCEKKMFRSEIDKSENGNRVDLGGLGGTGCPVEPGWDPVNRWDLRWEPDVVAEPSTLLGVMSCDHWSLWQLFCSGSYES